MRYAKYLVAVVLVVGGGVVGYVFWPQKIVAPIQNIPQRVTKAEYEGVITPGSTDALLRYASTKYGITFEFPRTWHMGDNHLGYGTFQIFNLAEEVGRYKNPDVTKIEMVIHRQIESGYSDIYEEASRVTKEVSIAGRKGIVEHVELTNGMRSRRYAVALPVENTFLWMTVGGNQENFYILDEVVKTLKFIQQP